MEFLEHTVLHAVEDTLPIIPFLLITYLVLEALEHAASDSVNAVVKRAGAAGPVAGAILGIVPQCGFSAMGATLYAGRVITLGTLIAVFLSTSDEMLPLLLAERVDAAAVVSILASKALIALVAGLATDVAVRMFRRNERVHALLRRGVLGAAAGVASSEDGARDVLDGFAEAGEGAEHIHRLCEHDHCGCDDGVAQGGHEHGEGHVHDHAAGGGAIRSIVRSALSHTVQVSLFIFLVTFALVAVFEGVGETVITGFLASNGVVAVFGAALVGLIPNCAASVVVTQLYLEGVLAFGPMLAGSLAGAGAGFLVLFRTNRSARENLVILVLLYAISVACGLIALLVA